MKHSYQTRRLLALRDMRHDGQNVITGAEVFATETDARYLIRSGHARDPEQAALAAPAAPPAAALRRGPGRPSKAELAKSSNSASSRSAPAGAMQISDFESNPDGAPDGTAGTCEDASDGPGAGESGSATAA